MPRNHLIKMLSNISNVLVTFTLLSLHPQMAMADELSPKEETRLIDYMVLQTGGYLGFVTVGVGMDFERHKVDMLIGYVPESIGGIEIMQLDFKYDWHPFKAIQLETPYENISIDPYYLGFSIIYGHHDDLFVELPDQYPSGYYPPTALRYTLNAGTSLRHGRYTFFIEYSILDINFVTFIKHPKFFTENYDYFGLEGLGSLAFGVKYEFE